MIDQREKVPMTKIKYCILVKLILVNEVISSNEDSQQCEPIGRRNSVSNDERRERLLDTLEENSGKCVAT